jgi:hypothetical protein
MSLTTDEPAGPAANADKEGHMPHYLIRFTTDEPDRVLRATSIRPESRDGFDVYVAYGSGRKVLAYFTGQHVLSVEETVIRRNAEEQEEASASHASPVLARLQTRWADLLGPVGENTAPTGYDAEEQVLTVECQPNWSLQMKLLTDRVIPILNSELGSQAIQRLSITPDPEDS